MTGELRCGEYSLKLKMNPWQHPIYDENIHRLFAMLSTLCSGCGGVVYLLADDAQTVTQEIFQVYQERLHELIGRNRETLSLLTNMVQVSLLLGTHRSWAAVFLKKSRDTLKNTLKQPSVETGTIWNSITLDFDLFGQMYNKRDSGSESESDQDIKRSVVSPFQRATSSALPPTYGQENSPLQTEPETLSATATAPENLSEHSDVTANSIVDFSSLTKLDWVENTKDWQKYVKIKEVKIDDVIRSCPMWSPAQPMRVTPDRESIRYLFESEKNMEETLREVTTMEPGFAIVCWTWRFHLSDGDAIEDLPPGHICDILTVTDTGRLTFWVVVNIRDEISFESQMEYLMTTGRMLKFQIVKETAGDFSNLWLDCRLLSLLTPTNLKKKVELRLQECQEVQKHLRHMFHRGVDFVCLQQAVARLILSKESPLKRCVGDHTSIMLTVQQAEVLMHKAKVNYITGPAGSGKSYTGTFIYKMYGKKKSVYICTTKEFLHYLKFNGCTGSLVLGDQDLLREIENGTFDNKICVVIDDCHKLECTRKSMKKLFKLLKKNKDMSLFVFADNDYQSFNRKRQQAIRDCIVELTRTVLNANFVAFPLTDIYRNTRKVVSFVQAAIQDIYDGHQKIECAHIEDGEGVECIPMFNLWRNSPDNDLVVYLQSLLLSKNYSQSEVAILLDSSCTPSAIEECKGIIETQLPSIAVQSADVFPRTGVIVDSVDSFLGLDASVCVFILSKARKKSVHPLRKIFQRRKLQPEMNMFNPRYEVFLASRATHKAVFVVPELREDLVHQMKFDHFQVCVHGSKFYFGHS